MGQLNGLWLLRLVLWPGSYGIVVTIVFHARCVHNTHAYILQSVLLATCGITVHVSKASGSGQPLQRSMVWDTLQWLEGVSAMLADEREHGC
jgi:hypothetical protein